MYDPKKEFKDHVKIWLVILGTLLAIFLIAALIGQVTAAPAQQSESPVDVLPTVAFLGTGPATLTIDPSHTFVIKYRANDYKEVTGSTYEAKAGERVWDFSFVPENEIILYSEEHSFGPVTAGCTIEYIQIDDDADDRINSFYVNGVLAHSSVQGMVTEGSFVVLSGGELTFFAHDSVGLAININCPTPTPTSTATPTATPTATSTPTATDTPAPVSGLIYLPLIAGRNEPPPTPTPTATPVPADWHFVGCWGDPHCWNGTFPAETSPFWQERPDEGDTWLSEWPNGRQLALAAHGHTIEFELQPYGDKQFISKVYVDGQEIQAKQGEVIKIDLGDVYVLVSESCGTFECQDPQIWWRQDTGATGLLMDVFNFIMRTLAALKETLH